MGIEELNELKDWFVDLTENLLTPLGNGQYEPINPDNVRAILALIDAEVERQSVTDEDIADTLEQLEYDVERINTMRGDEWDYEPGAEHMRKELTRIYLLAIEAVKAYRMNIAMTIANTNREYWLCSECEEKLMSALTPLGLEGENRK